jgi:serine/threonine protein kinase
MKLIEGGSLKDRRAEYQALPSGAKSTIGERSQRERKLAQLMADIARGAHHAHQRGGLHRDLKPGNVLIDVHGQPHVTDFGLAKLLESEVELTQTRAVLGTPEYMSPEQAAGNTRLITTATDVYSLGTMLYELLAGRLPFPADEPMSVINRVINDEPKPPRSLSSCALVWDAESGARPHAFQYSKGAKGIEPSGFIAMKGLPPVGILQDEESTKLNEIAPALFGGLVPGVWVR